jgi:hypothetical protein
LRADHGQYHDKVSLMVYGGHQANVRQETARLGTELDHALRTLALLREFTREVEILVPSSATGWATFVTIGADRVFMHPMGTLGGIASAASLAAVRHFQGLVQEAGGSPQDQRTALLMMAEAVGAWELGEARYAMEILHQGVRELVAGRFHRRQEAQNQALFEALVDPSCPLAQALDRRRTKEVLSLPVESTEPELAAAMWELHVTYERALHLGRSERDADRGAAVESNELCHIHTGSEWVQVFDAELH